MRRFVKFLLFFLLITIGLGFGIHAYYKHCFKQNLNSEELDYFIAQINNSEDLPDDFYKIYDEIHPESLENDLISSLIHKTECQSHNIARRIYPLVKQQNTTRIENLTFENFLTWEIEKHTDQKQCLNWNARNFDFLYRATGVDSASRFYFKKDLDKLNRNETETLIKMFKNPVLYNPLRKLNHE